MMSDIIVVSAAFYPDKQKECKYLIESCKMLGYELHLYGDEFFFGLKESKICYLLKELTELKTEKLILFCDASDVLLTRAPDEVTKRYLASKALILMSAEKKCYPQSLMSISYPKTNSPWRFLNSGAYIGRQEDIIMMLKLALKLKPNPANIYRSRDWENDQFLLSHLFLQGYGITLDTECKIFQSVGDITSGEYAKSEACLYHYNGHAPGIDEMFERRFGGVVCG